MTRTLELLLTGIVIGGAGGIIVGWWLCFENQLKNRATGKTLQFERKQIGL